MKREDKILDYRVYKDVVPMDDMNNLPTIPIYDIKWLISNSRSGENVDACGKYIEFIKSYRGSLDDKTKSKFKQIDTSCKKYLPDDWEFSQYLGKTAFVAEKNEKKKCKPHPHAPVITCSIKKQYPKFEPKKKDLWYFLGIEHYPNLNKIKFWVLILIALLVLLYILGWIAVFKK